MTRAKVNRALRWSIACVFAGCAQGLLASSREQGELTRFTFTEYHMGIDARLVVYAANEKKAVDACEAAYKRIAELEAVMSDYRPDSELMKLCSKAGLGPVRISDDLYRVLDKSLVVAKQSDGAFDITVGPLVQLWRKARKEKKLPLDADIEAAKKLVGWEKVTLDRRSRTATLAVPGMRLDLGGIGKGFASDEALKVLRRNGIKSALIEMGGDWVLGDAPPKTKGWLVEVPNAIGQRTSRSATPPDVLVRGLFVGDTGTGTSRWIADGDVRGPVVGNNGWSRAHSTPTLPRVKWALKGSPHPQPPLQTGVQRGGPDASWMTLDGDVRGPGLVGDSQTPLTPAPCPRRGEGFYFANCAVSSSGDTEQFVEIDGVRYSHVVDPKTGKGVSQRVQATVIAKDGFTSDPLSTALTIIDQKQQKALLACYPGVRAYIKKAT